MGFLEQEFERESKYREIVFRDKEQTKELTIIYVGLYREFDKAMCIAYKLCVKHAWQVQPSWCSISQGKTMKKWKGDEHSLYKVQHQVTVKCLKAWSGSSERRSEKVKVKVHQTVHVHNRFLAMINGISKFCVKRRIWKRRNNSQSK